MFKPSQPILPSMRVPIGFRDLIKKLRFGRGFMCRDCRHRTGTFEGTRSHVYRNHGPPIPIIPKKKTPVKKEEKPAQDDGEDDGQEIFGGPGDIGDQFFREIMKAMQESRKPKKPDPYSGGW